MIKQGQTVYFYQSTGTYEGTIVTGRVIAITKDLTTGTITYKVKTDKEASCWAWFCENEFILTADRLYTSLERAEKDWKLDIICGKLSSKLDRLEATLQQIFNEIKEPVVKENWGTLTFSGETISSTLKVNAEDITVGDRNLLEEIDKLKKEVASLKKKINPKKSKKPVEKKEEDK